MANLEHHFAPSAYPVSMLLVCLVFLLPGGVTADEPPALNPFGPKQRVREDAIPGFVQLSNGSLHVGQLYLTRDARLQFMVEQSKEVREIPLSSVKRIECRVEREWMEKEWRFKENANDEKVFTGRSYPARQYSHSLTLVDGRRLNGSLAGIVYVAPYDGSETRRFLFHKRDKGLIGGDLAGLIYVRIVELGEDAKQAALQRRAEAEQAANRRPK